MPNQFFKEKKSFTIRDLSKIERPREKLISKGPQNLKDEKSKIVIK